ncbi:MAG: hypothetical protein Q8R58_11295 [Sulfuricurvum sp.]|nr:hypothetical protein [Sulfuricurvum sp.]
MKFFRKNIGILYIFLVAIQVILIAQYFANSLSIPLPDYFYFESAALYYNDHKRVELTEYLIAVITLGLFFMGILIGDSKLNLKARRYALRTLLALSDFKNKRLLLIALFLFVAVPVLVFRSGGAFEGKLIIQLLGLCATIIFPFWNYFLRYERDTMERIKGKVIYIQNYLNSSNSMLHKRSFYIVVLIIGFLQLGYLFYDPIVNQPKIINEYLAIPEQTIMNDGQIIGNNDYLKRMNYLEIAHKEDVKNPFLAQKLSDPKIEEWIDFNRFEVHWQILSRFMIHHNSFMFIPIGDIALDKNISMINAQYGLGSAWLFEKLFSWIGGISFDGWLKINYASYYLYFGFFIIILFAITRSFSWTTAIFLLSIALVNNRGYDFLLLPPGESPWRHIFDIVIVYLIFLYTEKKTFVYYLLALIFGVISVVINPQIGLMIFVATIISGLFYMYRERIHISGMAIITTIAMILGGSAFIFLSSANDMAQYYLDGVIGFPISFYEMFKILIIFIVGYLLLWKILKDRLSLNYMHLVFLVIYVQELMFYVVWHYNGDGFRSRAYIYVLTVGLLLFPLRKIIVDRWKNYLTIALTVVIGVFYISSVKHVIKSKVHYEEVFQHHVTYEWNMDRAHIISTMNPLYFQNDVDLIKKYSKDKNGIYIVSEYDNFLPFLAHKYSLMPFFDLKWYLITPKEFDKSIKILELNKPEYIFVDTGIDRNINNEIIDSKLPKIGYLYQESVWRIQRLKLLYKVFQDVSNDYQLVEKGYLISVYKRKDLNEAY